MGMLGFRFRTTVARRWPAYLGSALVLALVGGVALAALSGARRTASAYPRLLRASNASTLAFNAGNYDPEIETRVARLPAVSSHATDIAFNVAVLNAEQALVPGIDFEATGSVDGRFETQDRVAVVAGRRAHPDAVDEVMINEHLARAYGYRAGTRLDLAVYSDEQLEAPDFFDAPQPPMLRQAVTVVGVIVYLDEVVQDDADRLPRMVLSAALTARARPWPTYAWQGLVLKGGDADVPGLRNALSEILPPDSFVLVRVTSTDLALAQRAIRPQSLALGVFGAIAAVATLLLVGQGVARSIHLDGSELDVWRALGAGPRSLAAASLVPTAFVLAVGTVAMMGVAVALSSLTPIGVVRRVEVDPGVAVDWTVLLGGAAAVAISLAAAAVALARREAPHRRLVRDAAPPQPSRLVTAASSAGLPAPAIVGVRFAVGSRIGRSAVPGRSVMAGSALAVLALVAALCFGWSLRSLVDHPTRYGWNWDAALIDTAGYGAVGDAAAHEVLDDDPAVAGWAGVSFGGDVLNGQDTPLLFVSPGDQVGPRVLSGRAVRGPDEIVLAPRTLERLGARVGGTVRLGAGAGASDLRVVGTASLPALGPVHGTHTSLGSGGILSSANIRSVGAPNPADPASVTYNGVLIRLAPGVDRAGTIEHLGSVTMDIGEFPGSIDVVGVQRPAEIANSDDMGAAPAVLAGALSLAALLSLGLTLLASVRRRRHDLALLKALGFTRGQVFGAVAWQATVTVLIGLLVGLSLGVVVGRLLWIAFARELAVVPAPVIPVAVLAGVVAAMLLLSNLVAAAPAWLAARTSASMTLRSD